MQGGKRNFFEKVLSCTGVLAEPLRGGFARTGVLAEPLRGCFARTGVLADLVLSCFARTSVLIPVCFSHTLVRKCGG